MSRSLGFIAVLLTAATSHAFELKHDSTGETVRWAKPAHFVMDAQAEQKLGAPGALAAVQAAMRTVEQSAPGVALSVEAGAVEGVGYDQRPGANNRNEIVIPEQWDYDPNAIAITVVTVDTARHEIIDADIAFNVEKHLFRVLPGEAKEGGQFDDIQNTITHELGHAVGLAHNPEVPQAVMYPGARRGEICKRTLSQDDIDGLLTLYPKEQSGQTHGLDAAMPMQGCSATAGSTSPWVLLLALLPFLIRGRKRSPKEIKKTKGLALSLALLELIALPAAASEPAEAMLSRAGRVLTGEVVSERVVAPSARDKLLFTELEVRVRECVKGDCPDTVRIRVPGGRVGHIEQVVEDHPVPQSGEVIALVEATPVQGRRRPAPRLYRLSQITELVAFAQALGEAKLSAQLVPVSPAPGQSPVTRSH